MRRAARAAGAQHRGRDQLAVAPCATARCMRAAARPRWRGRHRSTSGLWTLCAAIGRLQLPLASQPPATRHRGAARRRRKRKQLAPAHSTPLLRRTPPIPTNGVVWQTHTRSTQPRQARSATGTRCACCARAAARSRPPNALARLHAPILVSPPARRSSLSFPLRYCSTPAPMPL
ncbi:MAG: hypothetical protein J3K34DRAFT_405543 [Monoraphidium minutum]|nr:MAG: hypothetical protein J3K34DRAFT_405543 [Monoraphidium minutum]